MARGAGAQEVLPDCTQTTTYGSWTVTGARLWGSVLREVASGDETFKVIFDFNAGSFGLTFANAYHATIHRGGEFLGAYIYEYDAEFDDWFEWFDGDEVRVVNALTEGSDLAIGATYSDDSTESYTIDSFGFSDALGLMERQRDNAITLEDAGKCEYEEFEGCFLTTATCGVIGLPDDCFELRALRRFRDRYMTRTADRRAEIADYYAQAPTIAARLAAEPGGRSLRGLYRSTILPCVVLAALGFDRLTHRLYRRMMRRLAA
ncbi:MAG: hypothetical protein O3A96_14235 [Proteobacteria bacterium]|nr:hypothetical protein [Pseudomonadota bacterium]